MRVRSILSRLVSVLAAGASIAIAQGPATKPSLVEIPDARDPNRPSKAALFRAHGFPTVDAPAIDPKVLEDALRELPVEVLQGEEALKTRLKVHDFDVLVLSYGSAFPLGAWPAIRGFLERGGGLVVLGGAPFHQPMRWDGKAWAESPRQPTYARELLIGPAERVDAANGDVVNVEAGEWDIPFPKPGVVFELTVRFTTRKDFEKEDGTSGPRDALLRPLVHVTSGGLPVACPLLEIDRMRGTDAGGRWILAPSDAKLDAAVIRGCVERALEGAGELDVRPVHACVHAGESPVLRATIRHPWVRQGSPIAKSLKLTEGASTITEVRGAPECQAAEIVLPPPTRPGVHRVTVEQDLGVHPLKTVTGYCVRDDALLAAGPKLSVSRDWLLKDGKTFPVVGTTYMASDVHRKFLFEPNPAVWDRDFAEMKRLGVNFVRTGLWTAWSRAMLDSGAVDEGVLRALEAYVQIAASHGIVSCFNFFAFQPPMFGGANPYLDPRALEGQKALLVAVANRFRNCNWVHYDLINEPSYCPADQLWTNRPIGDDHEKRAWTEWVVACFGTDQLALRERWRDASADVLSIPKTDELAYSMIREHRRPRKAADFARFTNDVIAKWAADLRATLRAAGGDVLVTLGQDEGGTHVRPAQQYYAPSVDYTSVHTWWNNDDLLWDGVMTKVPEKPSLIQETGLMRLEDVDGNPWRSPEVAANVLEKKFAYAFMARGCGAVEWAWNINPYMPIENEATIGLFRPDGTAKPELRVLASFAKFFKEAAPRLADFEPAEVVMVIPHSRVFAGRPRGVDATKQVVKVLSERLGVVPLGISEHKLTPERLASARLVVAPVPEMADANAIATLREAAGRGVKVLVTGPLDHSRPVAIREPTTWGAKEGDTTWVTFDGGQSEWLRREDGPSLKKLEGNWWHEPLPLELAREEEPVLALLRAAAETAGVTVHPSATPVAARVLTTPDVALAIVVNETPIDANRRIGVDGNGFGIPVKAGRARLVLVERKTGEVLAATEGEEVQRLK